MIKNLYIYFIITMSTLSSYSQTKIYLTVDGVSKTATLVKNQATEELVSLLKKEPLTLSMTENGGFEKVGNLPKSLTTSDVRQKAESGDIMLYVGNVLCIFYGSNTWSYTKLGVIDNLNAAEIKDFLKGNPVNVTLSLDKEASIKEIKSSEITNEKVFDLNGNIITKRPLLSGIYIINGKKTLIK